MALVKCKECNGDVSDRAYSCPHCGIELNPEQGEYYKWRIARLKRIRIFTTIMPFVSLLFCVGFRVEPATTLFCTGLPVIGLIITEKRLTKMKDCNGNNTDNRR